MTTPQHLIVARLQIVRQVDGVDGDVLASQEEAHPEPVSPAKMQETLSTISTAALEEYSGNI